MHKKLIMIALASMMVFTGGCARKITENSTEETTMETEIQTEPATEVIIEDEEPFNWQPIVEVTLGNLSFEYNHCEGNSLRSCPAQELMDGYYWINYETGGSTDADGYKLKGDGFELLIVADIAPAGFDSIKFMEDYVYNAIVTTGVDNIKIPPEMREIGNEKWAYFATAAPNPEKVGEYLRMEQFALCKIRDELYSVHVTITDVNQMVFSEVQFVLSSMQILTYQERIENKINKTIIATDPGFVEDYDRTVVTGRAVLQTIQNTQRLAMAIVVKTAKNVVTGVINYNTPIGKRESRFNLTQLEIVGTPPDVERLQTDIPLDIPASNRDLEGALTKLSDDYINLKANFLAVLIYNTQDQVIGVYFEELTDNQNIND